MRLSKFTVAAVVFLLTFILSMASGFCADPVMECDPARTTGIGAVSFTDGNGNPVHITSVSHKAATSTTPAYCEIRGYRRPSDLFIIALPDSWTGRYWQTGNGGAAGALGRITPGISRGYVSASGSGGYDGFPLFIPPQIG